MMNGSEAQLLAAAVTNGDRQAFGGLVRLHQSALRLVLRRFTNGNEPLADELAQETFLRAYREIMNFRNESKFFTWLCQIAYHLYVDSSRKRQPLPVEDVEEAGGESANPSRGLALSHDLEQALKRLSDAERAAITLCYHRDLTHEEAAQIMDVPLGTLKSHVSRGKEKLSRRLRSWKEGD